MSSIQSADIEKFLLQVQKPARYIGGELNAVIKKDVSVRMAISYPDLYDVGMSNNGIRILYDRANSMKDVACERVFAVARDFESLLRRENIPLYTLETYTPLSDLDLLGFNLSHELLCTNVLQILDLGRIPLLAAERSEGHPIIMAGGEAVSNPFPMADFIDVFFIGDGEEGIQDILTVLLQCKAGGSSRRETIERLSAIEGVLNPCDYHFTYDGMLPVDVQGKRVKKRIYRGHEPVDPERPIVPGMRIAQERAVVEISRGCYNLCKFCHAGYYDLPYRSYDYRALADKVTAILGNTGYDELTLSSLSVSDYHDLPVLLNTILPGLTERGISVSLPSLRVDLNTIPVIEGISDVRKSSLTFAVESASEDMRKTANKRVSEADLLCIMEYIFTRNWTLVKLYFMVGLPGCGDTDEADAIIGLLKKIIMLGNKRKEIHVTLSPFVPKPHTPFQREKQMDAAYVEDIILRVKQGLPRFVKIKNHDVQASLLEGILARGDRRLGAVILQSYRDGCLFDSWGEFFRFDIWRKNLDAILPGWEGMHASRGSEVLLPWQVVDTGFDRLIQGWEKRQAACLAAPGVHKTAMELDTEKIRSAAARFEEKYGVDSRIRVRFTKRGPARFLPHLDFIEVVKRALRMADVPISFTQGFNKRERISLGYALSLGVESMSELCDMDLHKPVTEKAMSLLSGFLPEGIEMTGYWTIIGKESLGSLIRAFEYHITVPDAETFSRMRNNLQAEVPLVKKTKKGEKVFAFSDIVSGSRVDEGANSITLIVRTADEGSVRIDSIVARLAEASDDSMHGCRILKIGQYLGKKDGETELV